MPPGRDRDMEDCCGLRILIIQPWIRQGGAEQLSVQLSSYLEARGHQAPIATLFVDPRGLPPLMGRSFHTAPPWLASRFARSRALVYFAGPLVLLAITWRASRGADVVNPHNLPAPLVAVLAGIARRIPIIWTLNEVPVPLPPDIARELGWLERIAWLVGSWLAARVSHLPREILVLDEKTRRSVWEHYRRGATVAMPGVDVDAYGADRIGRSSDAPARLLWVGKLHPQKNPELALRTLARLIPGHPGTELTIVGDGPLRARLAALAQELRIADLVRWRANLPLPELKELYVNSDVLLMTATGWQAWGLTPFEALAAGTPSVVSAVAGNAEILSASDAALVVPPVEEDFFQAADRLLRDAALCERLVRNGRTLLSTELTWERYADACERAFEAALDARPSRVAR